MWELKILPGNISIWSTETLESTTHKKVKQQTDPKWQMHNRSFCKHTKNEKRMGRRCMYLNTYSSLPKSLLTFAYFSIRTEVSDTWQCAQTKNLSWHGMVPRCPQIKLSTIMVQIQYRWCNQCQFKPQTTQWCGGGEINWNGRPECTGTGQITEYLRKPGWKELHTRISNHLTRDLGKKSKRKAGYLKMYSGP